MSFEFGITFVSGTEILLSLSLQYWILRAMKMQEKKERLKVMAECPPFLFTILCYHG